ncbi:myotubularin domain-containing protein, putative [Bodo saltans]|uniref:Myotubularin domain-containing protein, putative n=1 Tax=Bodo saltans TaxID=75058 RepID=A0A0S4ITX6_BODSA|nr:myotubularin domain-containing protein, putative [Bodo saltans]|eukprot:CUF93018.1 myotubularin domain-containing protein, putative [Bodo saltans]
MRTSHNSGDINNNNNNAKGAITTDDDIVCAKIVWDDSRGQQEQHFGFGISNHPPNNTVPPPPPRAVTQTTNWRRMRSFVYDGVCLTITMRSTQRYFLHILKPRYSSSSWRSTTTGNKQGLSVAQGVRRAGGDSASGVTALTVKDIQTILQHQVTQYCHDARLCDMLARLAPRLEEHVATHRGHVVVEAQRSFMSLLSTDDKQLNPEHADSVVNNHTTSAEDLLLGQLARLPCTTTHRNREMTCASSVCSWSTAAVGESIQEHIKKTAASAAQELWSAITTTLPASFQWLTSHVTRQLMGGGGAAAPPSFNAHSSASASGRTSSTTTPHHHATTIRATASSETAAPGGGQSSTIKNSNVDDGVKHQPMQEEEQQHRVAQVAAVSRWCALLLTSGVLPPIGSSITAVHLLHNMCSQQCLLTSTSSHPARCCNRSNAAIINHSHPSPSMMCLQNDYVRQGVSSSKLWRMCDANRFFSVCSTYPPAFVVPISASDDDVRHAAEYERFKGRVDALTFYDCYSCGGIIRSAQPREASMRVRQGLQAIGIASAAAGGVTIASGSPGGASLRSAPRDRSASRDDDEPWSGATSLPNGSPVVDVKSAEHTPSTPVMAQHGAMGSNGGGPFPTLCTPPTPSSSGGGTTGGGGASRRLLEAFRDSVPSRTVVVLDLRDSFSAKGNWVKGGGREDSSAFPRHHCNLPNIHAVTSSFKKIHALVAADGSSAQDAALRVMDVHGSTKNAATADVKGVASPTLENSDSAAAARMFSRGTTISSAKQHGGHVGVSEHYIRSSGPEGYEQRRQLLIARGRRLDPTADAGHAANPFVGSALHPTSSPSQFQRLVADTKWVDYVARLLRTSIDCARLVRGLPASFERYAGEFDRGGGSGGSEDVVWDHDHHYLRASQSLSGSSRLAALSMARAPSSSRRNERGSPNAGAISGASPLQLPTKKKTSSSRRNERGSPNAGAISGASPLTTADTPTVSGVVVGGSVADARRLPQAYSFASVSSVADLSAATPLHYRTRGMFGRGGGGGVVGSNQALDRSPPSVALPPLPPYSGLVSPYLVGGHVEVEGLINGFDQGLQRLSSFRGHRSSSSPALVPPQQQQPLTPSTKQRYRTTNGRLVLLHCTDGWDRTSQVSALSQLLLDPHYRTVSGFVDLIEKDFVAFGHPFRRRLDIFLPSSTKSKTKKEAQLAGEQQSSATTVPTKSTRSSSISDDDEDAWDDASVPVVPNATTAQPLLRCCRREDSNDDYDNDDDDREWTDVVAPHTTTDPHTPTTTTTTTVQRAHLARRHPHVMQRSTTPSSSPAPTAPEEGSYTTALPQQSCDHPSSVSSSPAKGAASTAAPLPSTQFDEENVQDHSPIFLQFLDATAQLLRRYPDSFQFTDDFLLLVWDLFDQRLVGESFVENAREYDQLLMSAQSTGEEERQVRTGDANHGNDLLGPAPQKRRIASFIPTLRHVVEAILATASYTTTTPASSSAATNTTTMDEEHEERCHAALECRERYFKNDHHHLLGNITSAGGEALIRNNNDPSSLSLLQLLSPSDVMLWDAFFLRFSKWATPLPSHRLQQQRPQSEAAAATTMPVSQMPPPHLSQGSDMLEDSTTTETAAASARRSNVTSSRRRRSDDDGGGTSALQRQTNSFASTPTRPNANFSPLVERTSTTTSSPFNQRRRQSAVMETFPAECQSD